MGFLGRALGGLDALRFRSDRDRRYLRRRVSGPWEAATSRGASAASRRGATGARRGLGGEALQGRSGLARHRADDRDAQDSAGAPGRGVRTHHRDGPQDGRAARDDERDSEVGVRDCAGLRRRSASGAGPESHRAAFDRPTGCVRPSRWVARPMALRVTRYPRADRLLARAYKSLIARICGAFPVAVPHQFAIGDQRAQ